MRCMALVMTTIGIAALCSAAQARDYVYAPLSPKLVGLHVVPRHYRYDDNLMPESPPPPVQSLHLSNPPLLASKKMIGQAANRGSYQCVDHKCSGAIFVPDHTERDERIQGR